MSNLYNDWYQWFINSYGCTSDKNEFSHNGYLVYNLKKIDNNNWLCSTTFFNDYNLFNLVLDHDNKQAHAVAV